MKEIYDVYYYIDTIDVTITISEDDAPTKVREVLLPTRRINATDPSSI